MGRSLPEVNTLSLEEQVAQMLVVRASGYLFDHQIQYPNWEPPAAKLQYWLQHLGVGGVILLGGSAGELALRSQHLRNWAKIPLLIAADIEEGVEVIDLATAFIQGAKAYPILTTAKHFPGHGDTATDSHLDLPVLPHSPTRLAEIELPPFKAAIAAGVDAVMSAHLLIPSWDAEQPATLSELILTQQLRLELGFEGLIVTDALVMGAITNHYGANVAPVLAVEAGADILLMPVDPEGAIKAVCAAVRSGRILRSRISASVERIREAKLKIAGETTSGLMLKLAQPDALVTVSNILRETQLVRGSAPLCLVKPNKVQFRNLIVVDDLLTCDFLNQRAPAITLPAQLGYTTQLSDCHNTNYELKITNYELPSTLLQLFIRGNPFRGSAGVTLIAQNWLTELLQSGDLQALVLYGSPYVLEFLPILPPAIPCVFSYGQLPVAQAIALEALLGR